MIENPGNLAAGEVGVDQQAGALLYEMFVTFVLELLAKAGGTAILPDDGVVDGLAGCAVPDDGGFALVGDADGGNVGGLCTRLRQRFEGDSDLRRCDLFRVVLDPSGLRKDLVELALVYRSDGAVIVEQEGSGTCGALIERENVAHETSCFNAGLPIRRLRRRLGLAQESSNAKVVDCCADQSAQQRRNHWYPPHPISVGEAVVLESSNGGEEARAKIARGIDGISVHATEAHANRHYHQADHRRRKVGTGRDVELVRDGKHQEQEESRADDLIEESCLRPCRKSRESCKHPGSFLQLRVDLVERRQIVSVYQGGREERSCSLCDGIRQHLAPGKPPENGQGEGDCRVQMAARNFSRNVNSHGYREAPAQSDVGVA